MGIIAKLYADGQVYNVLHASHSITQGSDETGRPTSRPFHTGLLAVIESTKDTYFFEKAIHPTQQIQEIILEFTNSMPGSRTRRIRFVDCYVTYDRTDFKANGTESLTETLLITAAGIEDSHSRGKYTTPRQVTAFLSDEVALTTQDEEEDEGIIEEVKFTAKFERPDNYKGEFGFDWMRKEYMPVTEGGQGICEDYEKLKKEYTPITIEGEEYFVPWLSMFPNQKNVTLKLALDIKEGTPTDQDVIKLPAKDGIRFEPEEVKVSHANGTEITVHCNSSLTNDVKIELLDKEDQIVGKINIFKNANHDQLHFEITPVRILRGISKESDAKAIENSIDHPQGFGEKSKGIEGDLQNLQEYLNTQSLNQALLQCKIGKVYDVIINEEKWIKDDLIVEENCVFKGDKILEKFQNEFEKQHPTIAKKRGLILFLSPIGAEEIGGKGELNDIDGKALAIFVSNLKSKDTFAHEIGHVIGLTHSFQEWVNQEKINKANKYIKDIDNYFQDLIDNKNSKDFISSEWSIYKKSYTENRSYLNLFYRNPHTFDQATNENFMDYETLVDENNMVIRRNSKKRLSFWKYQWIAMQDDVLKFYNKK